MPPRKSERPRDLSPGEAAALASAAAEAAAPPRPTAVPTDAGSRSRSAGVGARGAGTVPTLTPPGRSQAVGAGAGAVGGASAWTTIAALWSINQGDNAWFYDTNVGWKKISPDSDVGLETVNAVAGFAKAFGSAVQYVTDDTTGMVIEITCF
jgi:hypothetical protein